MKIYVIIMRKYIYCTNGIIIYYAYKYVIILWNRLSLTSVNATGVNMFKNKIGNYFKRSVGVFRCGL